jgi:hypothetical protein
MLSETRVFGQSRLSGCGQWRDELHAVWSYRLALGSLPLRLTNPQSAFRNPFALTALQLKLFATKTQRHKALVS